MQAADVKPLALGISAHAQTPAVESWARAASLAVIMGTWAL